MLARLEAGKPAPCVAQGPEVNPPLSSELEALFESLDRVGCYYVAVVPQDEFEPPLPGLIPIDIPSDQKPLRKISLEHYLSKAAAA